MDKISKPFSLNQTDYKKILKDSLFFALVPITFYITATLGNIQQPDHVLSIKDFIPNNNTLIAIIAWGLNQILSSIRKFIQ